MNSEKLSILVGEMNECELILAKLTQDKLTIFIGHGEMPELCLKPLYAEELWQRIAELARNQRTLIQKKILELSLES